MNTGLTTQISESEIFLRVRMQARQILGVLQGFLPKIKASGLLLV